jgi:hypothetical protein
MGVNFESDLFVENLEQEIRIEAFVLINGNRVRVVFRSYLVRI